MFNSTVSRAFAILLAFTISPEVKAQFSETIQTDRPCQSIGSFTVGVGVLQFQQGLDFYQDRDYIRDQNLQEIRTWTTNNMIRYGLGRKLEVNAIIDYSFQTIDQNSLVTVDDNRITDITALDIGLRHNILEGKNGGPSWCIQGHLGFADYIGEYPLRKSMDVKLVTSLVQNLSRFQSATVNLKTNTFENLGYTLNYSLNLTSAFGWAIENYGDYIFNSGSFYTYFDTGFWYLLNNNVQLDIQTGFGNNDSPDIISANSENDTRQSFFIGMGISWRLLENNG